MLGSRIRIKIFPSDYIVESMGLLRGGDGW